jgi:hypothetical protein
MAHYAFLDTNNRVTEVIVGVHETELIEGKTPEEFYSTFRNQTCVRTSYNNIRKQLRRHRLHLRSCERCFYLPTTIRLMDT